MLAFYKRQTAGGMKHCSSSAQSQGEARYPPRPPYGPQHDFDKQGEAIGLVSMAISHSTMYIDCRQLLLRPHLHCLPLSFAFLFCPV